MNYASALHSSLDVVCLNESIKQNETNILQVLCRYWAKKADCVFHCSAPQMLLLSRSHLQIRHDGLP
jgi:hypothetical protein